MKERPTMMNEEQAAKYIGLSKRTLQAYRFKQKPPTFVKMGKSVRYLKDDLDAFIEANRVEPVCQ